MSAGGDQSLAVSYTQIGNSENPPYSNLCSPYTDPWGAGAWCAMFVSWCAENAGYPLPALNGAHGFSYVPSGQMYAYQNGEATGDPQPGAVLLFSWEAWHMEGGIAVCSYGAYAGAPAGDHTGFFAGWLGGGYMVSTEGNTSTGSWDDGGTVMERRDRYSGQVCCYWQPAVFGTGTGGGGGGGSTGEDEFMGGLSETEQFNMANRINAMYEQQNYRDFDALALLRDIFNMATWTNARTARAESDEYGTSSGGAVNFFDEVRRALTTPRLTSAQISAIADELPRNVSAADVEQATTKVLGAPPAA